jgi:hypothetical protein
MERNLSDAWRITNVITLADNFSFTLRDEDDDELQEYRATINPDGNYTVSWVDNVARIGSKHSVGYDAHNVLKFVNRNKWLVLPGDDITESKPEEVLPNSFKFNHCDNTIMVYTAVLKGNEYEVTWVGMWCPPVTYSVSTAKVNVKEKYWIILEDVNPEVMKEPQMGSFTFVSYSAVYAAVLKGNEYEITWKDADAGHSPEVCSVEDANYCLKQGYWTLLSRIKPNGVNKEGDPLQFNIEDLKINQRVMLRNGGIYIVAVGEQLIFDMGTQGKLVGVSQDGWNRLIMDNGNYSIVTVYAPPENNYELFKHKCLGELIWASAEL